MKLLIASVFACLVLSCSTNSAGRGGLAADEIDCGKAALATSIINLLPKVTLILSEADAASVNWQAELDSLKATAGDALLCAVGAVVRSFTTPQPATPTPSTGPARGAAPAKAAANGNKYLAQQKAKPVLP